MSDATIITMLIVGPVVAALVAVILVLRSRAKARAERARIDELVRRSRSDDNPWPSARRTSRHRDDRAIDRASVEVPDSIHAIELRRRRREEDDRRQKEAIDPTPVIVPSDPYTGGAERWSPPEAPAVKRGEVDWRTGGFGGDEPNVTTGGFGGEDDRRGFVTTGGFGDETPSTSSSDSGSSSSSSDSGSSSSDSSSSSGGD